MKAALLAPLPPPVGGIAKWAVNVRDTKLKNGWRIALIDTKAARREVYEKSVKRNIIADIVRCFRIWRRLILVLKDNEVKVVHSNIPANSLSMMRETICAILTKIKRRRFVIHFHCTVPNVVHGKIQMFIFKSICNISDQVITLNKASKDFVSTHTKASVHVVPNFVSDEIVLKHDKRTNTKISTALYVGGIINEKGCDDILTVANFFPDIEFRLVGLVSNEIKEQKKTANVVFTGVKSGEALEEEFLNADIFLFLSHMSSEGFSVALTEAMAHGLPCIVTDWAANRDMVENEGGIVVPIRDCRAVIDAIRELENCSKRKYCSKWNIIKVSTCYSQKVVTDKYVDIYED